MMFSKFALVKNIYQITDDHKGIFNLNVQRLCALFVLLTPSTVWYHLTFRTYQFSKYLKFLFRNESGNFEQIRLKLFLRMLVLLKRSQRPFYMPYEFNSNQVRVDHATLYCTTHLPIMELGIKALMENNYPIEVAIAAFPNQDLTITLLGLKDNFPVIKRDPYVLLKTKSILSKGSSVFAMIDRDQLDDLSPNSMKICRLASAKVVFVFAKVDKKGVIQIWLEKAPFPDCAIDEQIQQNLEHLKKVSLQIMKTYLN
ncbi:hypothetical protein V7S76_12040 [Aquirufa sp. ROCK2-A2]